MSLQAVPRARSSAVLDRDWVTLEVRQQPQQALLTSEHKEKTRKAVDPPPIVQLRVDEKRSNDQANWIVNPFMFMIALLVEADQEPSTDPSNDPATESWKPVPGSNLIGQTVSSLHRLKDVNNTDGGFFVFGDISCRRLGLYRLQFNLFDLQKNSGEAVFIKSKVSEPFQVVTSKEFRGQRESTPLSRTFSDQGVRLRLRKEQRAVSGTKRSYAGSPNASSARPVSYNVYGGAQADRTYAYPAPKRQRSGVDYNSQAYYPQQMSGNSMFQYNPMLQGGGYTLSSQGHPSNQIEQGTHFGGMTGQSYPQSSAAHNWQRSVQHGQVSAPFVGMGNGQYTSSMQHGVSPTQDQAPAVHAPHQNQQISLRGADDTYTSLGGLHTPSSIPDTIPTSSSQHQQSFLTSRSEVTEHDAEESLGHHNYAVQHPSHLASSHGHIGYRVPVATQPLPSYPPNMQPATSSAYDPQLQERTVARYHEGQFGTQNLYSDSARGGLASHGVDLSDENGHLDSGILTRSFIPSSYRQPQSAVEQTAVSYKEPYPTPHQTSPL